MAFYEEGDGLPLDVTHEDIELGSTVPFVAPPEFWMYLTGLERDVSPSERYELLSLWLRDKDNKCLFDAWQDERETLRAEMDARKKANFAASSTTNVEDVESVVGGVVREEDVDE